MLAWRVVRERHLAAALTGEGAALYPGRWNRTSWPVVYAAASRALAALEILTQALDEHDLADCYTMAVEFSDDDVESIELDALPLDWRISPAPNSTREFGTRWLREQRSLVLAVPSAVLSSEWNYRINPRHPRFEHLVVHAPEPLGLDPRVLRQV